MTFSSCLAQACKFLSMASLRARAFNSSWSKLRQVPIVTRPTDQRPTESYISTPLCPLTPRQNESITPPSSVKTSTCVSLLQQEARLHANYLLSKYGTARTLGGTDQLAGSW